MRRTVEDPNNWDSYVNVVPVVLGGVNGYGAIQDLDGIPVDADNLVRLDQQGLIPAIMLENATGLNISIDGSTYILVGQTKDYFIVNYDSFKEYEVTAINGTVVRNGSVITYTAGSEGVGGFIINGRTIEISVEVSHPNTILAPAISSPTGTVLIDAPTVTFVSSDFYTEDPISHYSSDWELAYDEAFATVIGSSYDDRTNLKTWTFNSLLDSKSYFARVRYKSQDGTASPWSKVVTFTTSDVTFPTAEMGKIVASDGAANNLYGTYVDTTATGDSLAVGATSTTAQTTDTGAVYVY